MAKFKKKIKNGEKLAMNDGKLAKREESGKTQKWKIHKNGLKSCEKSVNFITNTLLISQTTRTPMCVKKTRA